MHENIAVGAQSAMLSKDSYGGEVTVLQNIDRQIKNTQMELARLDALRKQIAESGLANIFINDLARALRY